MNLFEPALDYFYKAGSVKDGIIPAQCLYGRPVIPHKTGNSDFEYTDMRTGELVGMSEEGCIVAQNEDGDIVERHLSKHGEPYYYSEEVNTPKGKIKSLEEQTKAGYPIDRLEVQNDGEVVQKEGSNVKASPSDEVQKQVKAYNQACGFDTYA